MVFIRSSSKLHGWRIGVWWFRLSIIFSLLLLLAPWTIYLHLAEAPLSVKTVEMNMSPYHDPYCGSGKKIYIDLGALDGDTIRILQKLRPDFTSFKSYAWECNPKNVETMKRWIKANPELDVTLIEKAAWTEGTTLYFSTRAQLNAGKLELGEGSKKGQEVQSQNVAKWIMDMFQKDDFIFLKIDIEAAEYDVLPHIITTGAIEYIDELKIEWHDWNTFKTPERIEKRAKLEELLQKQNLVYKYATLDMDMYNAKTTFDRVPKYVDKKDYPHPWVDLHYFRQSNGCNSTWDI